MHIIVLIKQVPDIKKVKMDKETGTIIRKGVESVINPLDLYAIEAALNIKESNSTTNITVISMGPPSALNAIKEAIAMGADSGILLSDKTFAGSDTLATSMILGEAIKKAESFDYIICGERAIDGDTSQVGPEIASYLNLPIITYVNRIQIQKNKCSLSRRVEEGIESLSLHKPAVLTVLKEINHPRLPTYKGKKKANNTKIQIWNIKDLKIIKEQVGLKGSPTKVVKIFTPNITRKCTLLYIKNENDISQASSTVSNFLINNKYLQAKNDNC